MKSTLCERHHQSTILPPPNQQLSSDFPPEWMECWNWLLANYPGDIIASQDEAIEVFRTVIGKPAPDGIPDPQHFWDVVAPSIQYLAANH